MEKTWTRTKWLGDWEASEEESRVLEGNNHFKDGTEVLKGDNEFNAEWNQ